MPSRRKLVSHWALLTRKAMVANLKPLIERQYQGLSLTAAYDKIEENGVVSSTTMQRIMSGTVGPSIDTLSDLARHFGTTVPELLTPSKEPLPVARDGDCDAAPAQRLRRRRS